MTLTTAQKQSLKTAINASEFSGTPNNDTQNAIIAAAFNLPAAPSYWGWRSSVSRSEIYNNASPDNTFWDWNIYKTQSVPEQNAWVQMFMGDAADFSQANLRAGIGKIFGAANAQTVHCLAMGRRLATRFEKLFAVDTAGSAGTRGTAADPDTFTLEGAITAVNVEEARNS